MSQYANLRRKAMSNLMGEEMKAKEEEEEDEPHNVGLSVAEGLKTAPR
eukprot:COSAG04_NODE_3159_length_3102_cov_12.051615_2_plen_48_part_00